MTDSLAYGTVHNLLVYYIMLVLLLSIYRSFVLWYCTQVSAVIELEMQTDSSRLLCYAMMVTLHQY